MWYVIVNNILCPWPINAFKDNVKVLRELVICLLMKFTSGSIGCLVKDRWIKICSTVGNGRGRSYLFMIRTGDIE
jgi:hypothetical protein